jgi:ribosomal protein S18 acetylase RimI-like enzyme
VPSPERRIELANLYKEAFSGAPWFEKWTDESALAAIDQYIERGPRIVTIERLDVIVAFAIALPVSKETKFQQVWAEKIGSEALYLAEFAVSSAYRGQGLGKKVLEGLAVEAKAVGYASICARTRTDNTPAIKAFLSMGMKEVGVYSVESGGVVSERKVFAGNF